MTLSLYFFVLLCSYSLLVTTTYNMIAIVVIMRAFRKHLLQNLKNDLHA